MRNFTDSEFDIMVAELTVYDPPSFDMMLNIVEKTLARAIKKWCAEDKRLAGRQLEDDIMQETKLRVMKTCVTHFLKRTDELNNDPDGFSNWLYEVALNIKRDFANRQEKHDNRERGFEEGELDYIGDPDSEKNESREAVNERLAAAFAVVLDSGISIYKILTWLAQCVFIIEYDVAKKDSNEMLVEEFSEKTLYEMRDSVYSFAEGIPWMVFTAEHKKKIDDALAEEYEDGKTYGETRYKDFFMVKQGKATISDWIYRVNEIIKKKMGNGI